MSKCDLKKRILQAKNYAAIEFEKLAGRAKWKNERVRKEEYNKILENTKIKFNLLLKDVNLQREQFIQGFKGNWKLLIAHLGPESPMRAVEVHLLDIILQLAVMHQPITPMEAIELANSLIKGTVTEQEVLSWKKEKLMRIWLTQLLDENGG